MNNIKMIIFEALGIWNLQRTQTPISRIKALYVKIKKVIEQFKVFWTHQAHIMWRMMFNEIQESLCAHWNTARLSTISAHWAGKPTGPWMTRGGGNEIWTCTCLSNAPGRSGKRERFCSRLTSVTAHGLLGLPCTRTPGSSRPQRQHLIHTLFPSILEQGHNYYLVSHESCTVLYLLPQL